MSFDPQGRVSAAFGAFRAQQREPQDTLCESRIARAHKRSVFVISQIRVVRQAERAFARVNWDAVLLVVLLFACFWSGLVIATWVELEKVCR